MKHMTRSTLLALLLCAALLASLAGAFAERDVVAAPVEDAVGEVEAAELWTDDIAETVANAAQAEAAGKDDAVALDPAHFPDEGFRNYLATEFDGDGDGLLSAEERSAVTSIYCNGPIADVTGIALFPALQMLEFECDVAALDITACPRLETLRCLYCTSLTSLKAAGSPALKTVYIDSCTLPSLDVSGCPALESVSVWGGDMQVLDAHGCPKLTDVHAEDAEGLALKLNDCAALSLLEMSYAGLSAVDVTGCANLQFLYLAGNPITALDLTGCAALETLDARETNLAQLDVSGHAKLKTLYCSDSRIVRLSAAGCKALADLECYGNPAMALDLSGCAALTYLTFYGDEEPLTALNVSGCTALGSLECSGNQLKSLNVSNCTSLNYLSAAQNHLASVDITGDAQLIAAAKEGATYDEYDESLHFRHDDAAMSLDYGAKLFNSGKQLAYDVLPDYIEFTKYSASVTLGKTLKLKPVATPAQATPNYTWTSSDNRIAKVSSKGVVTPVKKGSVTITATARNGAEASIEVNVVAPKPTKVAFKKKTFTVKLGKTLKLKPVLTPSNAETTFTWSSSRKAVATVNKSGVVTPVKKGSTVITVKTKNGKKATCTVKVVAPKPTKVRLSADSTEVLVGKKLKLTATLTPAQAETTLTWTSSKKSVATVNKKGVVTGKKARTATITVKTANGKKHSIKITVKKKAANPVKCRALVVGQSNDPGGYALPGCANDATLMKAMLESVKGAGADDAFKVTVKRDQSYSQLKSAIQSTFSGADDNDISLFYYSGHGVVGTDGAYAGAMVMIPQMDYLRFDELADLLSRVPGKVIVMCDSCGSGAAIYAGTSEQNRARAKAEAAALDAALVSAFQSADPGLPVDANGNAVFGDEANLGELRIANKFYVLTAARHNEMSWEDGTNGMFTQWLADGVGESGRMPADRNNDGAATLNELFRHVDSCGADEWFYDGQSHYQQHVQVYPKNSSFVVFRR